MGNFLMMKNAIFSKNSIIEHMSLSFDLNLVRGHWVDHEGVFNSADTYATTYFLLVEDYANFKDLKFLSYCGDICSQIAYFDSERNFISYQTGKKLNTEEKEGNHADWRYVFVDFPENAKYFVISQDLTKSLFTPSGSYSL